MQQVPVLVPQSSYGDGNTTVVIARIYCILRGCYDVVWGTLEFPSFNFNGIFDKFCILKGMSYMMPLSRHALSLQTRLHRQFILGTIIPPTPVIILLHVICCLFKHSLCLLLGTIQLPCKGVCSLHCRCPCRLYSQVWALTSIELKWGLTYCHMDLFVVCKLHER